MKFLFTTNATMKEYNKKKWWINSDYIGDITATAESVESALEQYAEIVKDKYCVDISKNALKNKSEMYIDSENGAKQRGYVITAKTDFQDNNYKWSTQYIDLWINIAIITSPFEN